MRILLIHNFYQLHGGEDEVLRREKELLTASGHWVAECLRHNDEIRRYGWWKKITLPARTVWAWDSYAAIRALLRRDKPDVAHFHNTFPLISPAAYYACRDAGVPVVQSLHNPRLLCPNACFVADHRLCEDCLGKMLPWPAVIHACYHGSRAQTCVVASMLVFHRLLKSWQRLVDSYIVFTEFYRQKFIEGGLPAEKLMIKPHFVEDCGMRQTAGNYALFIGRLAPEKGISTLLKAWERLNNIPLKIRGEGPMTGKVREFVERSSSPIQLLPQLSRDKLVALMQGARFLVWPSEGHYETFGLVAAEAFTCGVPVIASAVGAMKEMVAQGRTGLHFTPGDPEDLAAKAEWAWTHPKEMEAMGREARAEYEAKYTAERNYQMLMEIYHHTIETYQRA